MVGSSSGFEAFVIAVVIIFMIGMAAGRLTSGVGATQRVECVSHSVKTGECTGYKIIGADDGE